MDWRRIIEPLRWRGTRLADRLAQAVADVCCEPLSQQVSETVYAMNVNEATGYITARCSRCVAMESQRILREHGLRQRRGPELARRAIRRLVSRILHEMPATRQFQPARRKAA